MILTQRSLKFFFSLIWLKREPRFHRKLIWRCLLKGLKGFITWPKNFVLHWSYSLTFKIIRLLMNLKIDNYTSTSWTCVLIYKCIDLSYIPWISGLNNKILFLMIHEGYECSDVAKKKKYITSISSFLTRGFKFFLAMIAIFLTHMHHQRKRFIVYTYLFFSFLCLFFWKLINCAQKVSTRANQ